jgi:hypothetical protein
MAKYVLVYTGGGGMAQDAAAQQQIMEQWGRWFGSLGEGLVDGGNPFGPSASIGSDGAVTSGGSAGLTGYSIIKGDSLQAATEAAKGCPVLSAGGSVEVYETFDVM